MMNFDDVNEYFRGERDCVDGVEHTDNGYWYNRGYREEYQAQQMHTNQTKEQK